MNVENQPLVKLSKILFPSMHLKLGLTKNSVKIIIHILNNNIY